MAGQQSGLGFFTIASIVSPFLSAALSGLLTYHFTTKAKRLDILYANKIPAFKEIAQKLIGLKKYCIGVLAYYQGSEYSPYYTKPGSGLHHRTEIAENAEMNVLFLSGRSREKINKILDDLSIMCNLEVAIQSDPGLPGMEAIYERMLADVEGCVQCLYADLNLKK